MYSGKKITREDTWRPDELRKHIRSEEEEEEESRRRRERSHRDPERERTRRHREESGRRAAGGGGGGTREEPEKESRREKGRSGDGLRERDREREREREKDLEREKRTREKYRDREKEKERRGDGLRERDRERERDKRIKEKDRDIIKEKDRERDREREHRDRRGDAEREKRDRGKDGERDKRDREREKRDKGKDRDRPREKERDKAKEDRRDRGDERDKEKDREIERTRRSTAEREHARRQEKNVGLDSGDWAREREKDRKERQRERERGHGGEERREQERRERHRHRDQTDREEKSEHRRREKGHHEDGETERRHRHQGREREETEMRHLASETQRHHEQQSKPEAGDGGTEDTPEEAEDDGNGEYEDDFEDYEEDFEEFEEDKDDEDEKEEEEEEVREAEREMSPRSRRELEAIQRAMEKENELVRAARSTSSTGESQSSNRASADLERKSRTYSRVIDFTSAREREINQQAAQKQKKRSAELLRLIELDLSVTECLLDLPPVREYDLYIKSYGTANTRQAYVQCNEDNVERDTQTEDADTTDKWTQHPPETSAASGGTRDSQNASGESVTRTTADSKRLVAFLRSATQVMAVLLEENIAESNSVKKLQSQTHTHSFSDGCVHLNTKLEILQGRQVTLLHFSRTQTHTLLSVHALRSGSSDVTLDSKSVICVWNIWEPSTPQRILVYEAEVRSCCFSPGKATLVFAGTDVGSVLVWDLREHSGSHPRVSVCEEEWTLRHPTFSTDAVLLGAGHSSPVVSVEPVLVNLGAGLRDPLLPDQDESLGVSFQLGTLDENGLLNLWVVIELPKADDSGSQTDLGLRPGGKVKLLHSSSLQTTSQVDKGVIGVMSHLSLVLKFLPSDSNHYFIGSSNGLVRHGTRHGLRAMPKLYRSKDGERPAQVTSLEFCPNGQPFFLAGCSDGSVRLHALAHEDAVCEWTVGSGHAGAVQCVRFSPTRCSVFCVLDSESVLHIWDLTQRDDAPLITHDLHVDPASALAMFGDATRQNPYSGIALAKHSGSLEIHFLLPSLTLPQASDAKKLQSLAHDTL